MPRRRARGPDRAASSSAPGSRRARARSRRSSRRARATSGRAFAAEHDCCLEPVLDLDEALDSELVRAREMVVELDQPGAERPVRLLGVPVKLSRTPGDADRAARPGARRAHRRGAAPRPATPTRRSRALEAGRRGRPARPRARRGRSCGVTATPDGLLKMSELAERSGVSAGTIKHYLREGLLGAATGRAHVAQHGLLPAGLRRAHPARSSACRRSASCRCA